MLTAFHINKLTSAVRYLPQRAEGEILERGGESDIIWWERTGKYYKILTKLFPPNLQVTLSQVPPSQKEPWGLRAHCISTCVLT